MQIIKLFQNPKVRKLEVEARSLNLAQSALKKSYEKHVKELKAQIKKLSVSRDTAKTIYTRIDNILTANITYYDKVKKIEDTVLKIGGKL